MKHLLIFFLSLLLTCSCYSQDYTELRKNPYISKAIRQKIKPYRLKSSHPAKVQMDSIFTQSRATQDYPSLVNAGFTILCQQPRSFICVAKHPTLQGYLLKLAFDNTNRRKKHTPFWEWFFRRCENAKLIRKIIRKNNLKHFTAAHKWIYPLPPDPSPPDTPNYTRKLAVLLVSDMNLVSSQENLAFWKTRVTPEILDELFIIVSFAKHLTLRPDNIWLTTEGKFAFIDTEYSNRKTNFYKIMEFLSDDMKTYWEYLINVGGPVRF